MRHLYDKKISIYHNQTGLQHLLRNKLNIEYFACDKFNITSLSMVLHMNKFGYQSIKPWVLTEQQWALSNSNPYC